MKILHISKYYPPYSGGIEDVCYNIVNGVEEIEQKVLCFNDGRKTISSQINNIEVIRSGRIKELFRQPISFSFYYRLKKILKEYKPNIIYLHLPNPLVCLYVLRLIPRNVKLLIHWHSDIIVNQKIYKLFLDIERQILDKADCVIVTSPNYLEHSSPLKNFVSKSVVIPNMVSLDKLNLNDEILSSKIDVLSRKYENKKIVFFMGRHVEYKGIQYLLESEKYIKSECVILIAGTGPLTKQLKESNNSDRIKFIGRIPDEDISAYMKLASIFAFPSITRNEAFGVVLAEAMYCKAVPVTFEIKGSGVNWVSIANVTGLEVENRNAKKFGEAINQLLEDDDLRDKLANNAYNRVVENFTMKTIKLQIEKVYNALDAKDTVTDILPSN